LSEEVVIISGARTAIGRFGGAFVHTPASDLGAVAIRAAMERSGVNPDDVDHVFMGCVGQVAEDAYLARHSAIKAGVPITTPALTLNRLCASGLEAINTAARYVELGDAELCIAGGAENMSMLPYYLRKARYGYRLGDDKLEDGVNTLLSDPFKRYHMGVTAENLAEMCGVERDEMDEVALRSQERAIDAIESGRFKDEIAPIQVRQGRETVAVDQDEHPRATTVEALGKLPAVFKEGGKVTAGNASGINDGAAAVVVTSRRKAEQLGLKPQLRLISRAEVGVDPAVMGIGPVPATKKALERAGLTVDQMDLVELNEAFASVASACSRELNLDPARTNVNGGAIALGHPVGATGAILTVKLMYELQRRQGRYGLVTLCVGGGQGIASIFERVN
jgi:acetyl-CoA C-acetyltransferase